MHRCSACDDHAYAAWPQPLLHPVGYLSRQALLNLEVAGEQIDDATELGEADNPLAGKVRDVCRAVKWQQVVSAQRLKGNVANEDQLVITSVVRKRGRCERRWT